MAEAAEPRIPENKFAIARRGYDPVQVDDHIRKLIDELKQSARSRDEASASVAELTKALNYAQTELQDAKTALTRVSEDPAGPAAMSERVKAMMQLAEEEIADKRQHAEDDAAATRAAADRYAEETRQEANDEAERLAAQAAEKRAGLDKEAEQRRVAEQKKVEEELAAKREQVERETNELRAETDRITAEQREETDRVTAAQRAETERVTAEMEQNAKQRTDAMLSEAERKLTEANRMRKEALELRNIVAERLSASHTALQDAIERLGPSPEEEQAAAAKGAKEANGSGDGKSLAGQSA